MSESELAVIKPEALKSYIWLQCFDGSIQQVEEEVAMFCPMICREILKNGTGSSKNHAIALPERVNPASLSLILDYCRFHQIPGRSNKERKSFDEKFVRIDTERLCELTSAADSLQLKPLVDLTSRALARIIEGKTPEEIREIFHLPDDLTEEEKLEPLKNINDDPRIRLLNRLYAKKRKELKERQKLKDVQIQEEQKDERSVDEILCFINGDGGSGGGKAVKNKKKNKRRKESNKNHLKTDSCKPVNEEGAASLVPCNEASGNISTTPCQSSDVQDDVEDPFEDADLDDGLDPAMKEELDREVEDFARRLNSVWPERMHLSLGQDRRLEPNMIGGNGSLQRFAGQDRRPESNMIASNGSVQRFAGRSLAICGTAGCGITVNVCACCSRADQNKPATCDSGTCLPEALTGERRACTSVDLGQFPCGCLSDLDELFSSPD